MIFAKLAIGIGAALIGAWIGTLAAALLQIPGTEAAFSIGGALIALTYAPWGNIESNLLHDNERMPRSNFLLPLVVVIAAFTFRLENLGWGEFQGDEARAMLLAEKVTTGSPEVLFSHRKGPGEILTAAAAINTFGSDSEFAMRLPFAISGIAALAAIAAVVTVLASPWLGILGFIVGLQDGVLLGFSRIVQYQMPMLLLCGCGWIMITTGAWRRYSCWLGLFFGAALLCHYDAVFLVAPGLVLCGYWALNRESSVQPFIVACFTTGLICLAFYVPFVLSTSFDETNRYLLARASSTPLPKFNFPRWFNTWSIYSGWIASICIPALFLLGIIYRRKAYLGRQIFIAVVWSIPLIVFGFFFAKPNTHFLIATPALIVSLCLLFQSNSRRSASRPWNVIVYCVAIFSLIGSIKHQRELFFAQRLGRPNLRRSVVEFGFNHRTGLRAAAQFLRNKNLTGSAVTNDDPLVANWYLRANSKHPTDNHAPELALIVQRPREPTATNLPIHTTYSLVGRVFVHNERTLDIFRHNAMISDQMTPERIYSQ